MSGLFTNIRFIYSGTPIKKSVYINKNHLSGSLKMSKLDCNLGSWNCMIKLVEWVGET